MYFIIISLFSNMNAFPSISCFRNSSAWIARAGSCTAINCITSSIVQSLAWPRGICGLVVGTGTIVVGIETGTGMTVIGAGASTIVGAAATTCTGRERGGCAATATEARDEEGDGWIGTVRGGLGCTGMLGAIVLATDAGAMFVVGVKCAAGMGACAGDVADADTIDEEDAAIAAAAAAAATATGLCSSTFTVVLWVAGAIGSGRGTTTIDDGVG